MTRELCLIDAAAEVALLGGGFRPDWRVALDEAEHLMDLAVIEDHLTAWFPNTPILQGSPEHATWLLRRASEELDEAMRLACLPEGSNHVG